MKLTIRTNPEIIIEIEQDKALPVKPIAADAGTVTGKDKFLGILDKAIHTPAKKIGKGLRRCKKCGEPGHRKDNCPNGKVGDDDEDLKGDIVSFKKEGWTSDGVAKELGIPLETVNKYW